MTDDPTAPNVDHLDGMTSRWEFLASLMEPLPPHARVTVHPEAIATADPRPALVELVVELELPRVEAVPAAPEPQDEPAEVIVIPDLAPVRSASAPRRRSRLTPSTQLRRPRTSRGRRTLVA